MKKTIFILLIAIATAVTANSQDLIIPVQRNSSCTDSSLFNFKPSTVLLRNIGAGDSATNLRFYYQIIDSNAYKAQHYINNTPYTRSCTIEGNIQLPIVSWISITIPSMNTTGKTTEELLNVILNEMDMSFDSTRKLMYGNKELN